MNKEQLVGEIQQDLDELERSRVWVSEYPWAESAEEARRSFVFVHMRDYYNDGVEASTLLRDMERVARWLRTGESCDPERVVSIRK